MSHETNHWSKMWVIMSFFQGIAVILCCFRRSLSKGLESWAVDMGYLRPDLLSEDKTSAVSLTPVRTCISLGAQLSCFVLSFFFYLMSLSSLSPSFSLSICVSFLLSLSLSLTLFFTLTLQFVTSCLSLSNCPCDAHVYILWQSLCVSNPCPFTHKLFPFRLSSAVYILC